jgi:branched-chain amino acid transport system permease protein
VLLACVIVAMLASGLIAVLLERVAYRPLRRRGSSRLAALISAIGASFVLQEIFGIWYTRDAVEMPNLMGHSTVFKIGSAAVTSDDLLVIITGVAMMILLDRLVATTKFGRGIRAVAQDPETSTLMGVNLDRVIVYTFLIGGLMAGVAATLYGVHYHQTRYDIGVLPGIKAFTAAVLGGIGNLRGALLGGLTIGLLEFYGSSLFGSQWENVVVFVVLVVVLLFRPSGILGEELARARA